MNFRVNEFIKRMCKIEYFYFLGRVFVIFISFLRAFLGYFNIEKRVDFDF